MTTQKKEPKKHVHEFELREKRVALLQGRKIAFDNLKQRACKCGRIETYDLEREIR